MRLSADFPAETTDKDSTHSANEKKTKREKKTSNQEFFTEQDYHTELKQIRSFPDKQELKEFTTTKHGFTRNVKKKDDFNLKRNGTN